eukprot:9471067-Heterocapsa_arctica.AAC.1
MCTHTRGARVIPRGNRRVTQTRLRKISTPTLRSTSHKTACFLLSQKMLADRTGVSAPHAAKPSK